MGNLAPITLSDAIKAARREVGDWIDVTNILTDPPSHMARQEPATPVSGLIDNTNKAFRVNHYPIISTGQPIATLIQVVDQAGNAFVVDTVNSDFLRGIIVLTTAPQQGTSLQILVTYFSIFYVDNDYIEWIQRALEYCGFTAVTALTDTLPTDFRSTPAVMAYVKYLVYKRNSTQTAGFFNFSVGGKTEDKGQEPEHWMKLAEEEKKIADAFRDDPYKRQGRREAPTWAFNAPVQPRYTPPR